MAGVIGLRGPDIEKRDILQGYKVQFEDADRPYVRPHTGLPVLTIDKAGKPNVRRHVFGFSRRFTSFNARDDKLETGKMWSAMFGRKGHHGVAPVSYILEWSDLKDGHGKRPFRIERQDGAAMCVPALVGGYWEEEGGDAFSLVTIEPNQFISRFHNRMIGQLTDDMVDVWLHPEDSTPTGLRKCLVPPGNEELVAYPVRGDVAKADPDDPNIMQAVGEAITWADMKDKARPKSSKQATL